ncbi:Uncharacterised protein [Bordetella pertussis]|nr:Uncharacterised protein [Bordetella pertussis]
MRVGIQRQVIGQQVQFVAQRQRQAGAARAEHAAVLVAPEPAVVHQHRVGAALDRRAQKRLGGRHAGDNVRDLGLAFDLQPVGTIVLESRRLQRAVQPVGQLADMDRFHYSPYRKSCAVFG